MKTAEKWIQENNPLLLVGGGTYNGIVERYKQIQLDALKEGVRRAAGLCDADFYEHNECRKAILTAADQLTEKDLDIRTNNSL
jgi:hypothetical protein